MPKLSYSIAAAVGVPQSRYRHLIDQIVAGAGEFVSIPLDDLAGDHPLIKQSRLLNAAKQAGVRITTTSRAPGHLFARLLQDPADAVVLPSCPT